MELQRSILPAVSKLYGICKGPRTIILKRNAKHDGRSIRSCFYFHFFELTLFDSVSDYNRIITSKAKGSDLDRFPQDVLAGAEIFVALHHQLLAELPLLLEGFAAVLNLVVRSLTDAHTRYYQGVRELLARFWAEYPPVAPDPEGISISSTGPAIIRVWEDVSATSIEMMEDLSITKKSSCFPSFPPKKNENPN